MTVARIIAKELLCVSARSSAKAWVRVDRVEKVILEHCPDLMSHEFQECPECAAKPGSPPLCHSCLHNRQLVSLLKQLLHGQA